MTKLNDRERILTAIIRQLQSSALLCRRGEVHDEKSWAGFGDGAPYVHFAYYRKPVPGDLVIGNTGRIDQWKIAFYVECTDPRNELHVLRDINTDQLCNYGNESFVPIVGIDPITLLTGERRKLYVKVIKAFAQGGEYSYRFGGFEATDNRATVWVRESHGGFGQPSEPFSVEFDWTPRTTIKAILKSMRDGGYGTRDFAPHRVTDDFGQQVRANRPHTSLAGQSGDRQ